MMISTEDEPIFQIGSLVERNIDGVWFEAVVTGVTDSALFTFYSIQYTDDGNIELDVDEADMRQVISRKRESVTENPCQHDGDNIDKELITAMEHLSTEDAPITSRNLTFYSADDLNLRASRTLDGSRCSQNTSLSPPDCVTLATDRRRRWSFEASPLFKFRSPTPPIAFPSEILQRIREKRSSQENPRVLFPLAGRCELPSCRKMTIYRCRRCNHSFSCSKSCQKKVWLSGHREVCSGTPFVPLFTPPPAPPVAVAATSVSVQNDWMQDDPLTVTGTRIQPRAVTSSSSTGALDHLAHIDSSIFNDDFTKSVYNKTLECPQVQRPSALFNERATAPLTCVASTTTTTTTATTFPPSTSCTFNPLVTTAPLNRVPEESVESDTEEFSRKVNQFCEIFSRSPSEVSRVLKFYGSDEDAAVECLVRGESKTEEEVTEAINRQSRKRQAGNVHDVRPAAPAPPPAYSAGMTGIDENEGIEMKPTRSSVGVGGGTSEDWSHLYSFSEFEMDQDEPPPLIDVDNCHPPPPSSSPVIDGQGVGGGDCENWNDQQWWKYADKVSGTQSKDPDMITGRSDGSCNNSVDENDSRSNFVAPDGSKNLLYFIFNAESMAVSRPVTNRFNESTGQESAIIFEGAVYLGKRMVNMTVSCLLKTIDGRTAVEQINVEVEPRDSIEALQVGESGKSTQLSAEIAQAASVLYGDRLIDVDTALPNLYVVLSDTAKAEDELTDAHTLHVHELNLKLSEAIDLMVLHCEQEESGLASDEVFDAFSTREYLDQCFWAVARGVTEESDTRKRSGSEDLDVAMQKIAPPVEDSATTLAPHALGVALVKALLLHMRTGLLNPFSSNTNSFFHGNKSPSSKRKQSGASGNSEVTYMKYVLLAYQVRYKVDGETREIQSDRAERVDIRHQQLLTYEEKSDNLKEECFEKNVVDVDEELSVQELVDILMVDREAARAALLANNGDLNQAMEWLLSKLDYS
mmetsp:Transcript_32185/g.59923  ORF Transcript_32185/g.59923 Transcript_32185/m.59923 type:complete len:975 (+) Transcript_32185:114-3038(+)